VSAFNAYFDTSYPVDISAKRQVSAKTKAGGTITLAFTITNTGDEPIEGAEIMVTTSVDMSLVKASHKASKAENKKADGPTQTRACDSTSWALPFNLAAGKSGMYKLTFRVDACAAAGSYEVAVAVGATQLAPRLTVQVTCSAWADKKCSTGN
jgi:uncharacterized repeat protein (TIGR01451 family)